MGGWLGGWVGWWVAGGEGRCWEGGWAAGVRAVFVMCSQSAYLIGEQVCDLAAHFDFCRSTWLHILLSTGRPGDSYLPTLITWKIRYRTSIIISYSII